MNNSGEDDPRVGRPEPSTGERRAEQVAFYQQLTAELLRLVREAGVEPEEADDVVQIAWLKFFEHRPTFTGEHAAAQRRAWLATVASHEVANLYRDDQRHPSRSLDLLLGGPRDRSEDGPPAAEQEALLGELGKRLNELRDRDPVNHRLLVEHHVEGRSIKELAEAEGLTVHAVWNRLERTRAKLREQLQRFRDEGAES